jgi:hypothetical protein
MCLLQIQDPSRQNQITSWRTVKVSVSIFAPVRHVMLGLSTAKPSKKATPQTTPPSEKLGTSLSFTPQSPSSKPHWLNSLWPRAHMTKDGSLLLTNGPPQWYGVASLCPLIRPFTGDRSNRITKDHTNGSWFPYSSRLCAPHCFARCTSLFLLFAISIA